MHGTAIRVAVESIWEKKVARVKGWKEEVKLTDTKLRVEKLKSILQLIIYGHWNVVSWIGASTTWRVEAARKSSRVQQGINEMKWILIYCARVTFNLFTKLVSTLRNSGNSQGVLKDIPTYI